MQGQVCFVVPDYLNEVLSLTAISVAEFKTNKPSDVISTLVSIYDSKDLFVKELQVLLAQRLLAIKNNDMERIDKEVSSHTGPPVKLNWD